LSADPYSDRVRELFANPDHAGELDGGSRAYVDSQGVRIALTAQCDDGLVGALRFKAWGCPHLLAAAEAFCRQYEGRAISAVDDFQIAELMQTLPVPTEKTGRILVLEDAVQALGRSIRQGLEK
jgi:NifU-like protein involved in Fe-S cluster formation